MPDGLMAVKADFFSAGKRHFGLSNEHKFSLLDSHGFDKIHVKLWPYGLILNAF